MQGQAEVYGGGEQKYKRSRHTLASVLCEVWDRILYFMVRTMERLLFETQDLEDTIQRKVDSLLQTLLEEQNVTNKDQMVRTFQRWLKNQDIEEIKKKVADTVVLLIQ